MPDKIYIYGDSLLKATVPDGDFHYHFHINEVMQRYQTKLVEVVNRSKMGATIRKGGEIPAPVPQIAIPCSTSPLATAFPIFSPNSG